ncbi:hypothetical protein X733_33460 [Mesorhizobium sp. L2C067A000]|nr:hypothetical protein X733_33460 [Mesorhizobium sp. L2C067A000]
MRMAACIMVFDPRGSTAYKLAARLQRLMASSPQLQIVDLSKQHLPTQCNSAAVLVTIKGKSLREGQRPTLDRHCARRPMNRGAEEE